MNSPEVSSFRVTPVDPTFTTHRASRIRHEFDRHPLMQLPALEALAHAIAPNGQCRFVRPGVTPDSEFKHESKHPDGRGITEFFRRIEEPGSWIALYNVERHPDYRGFVDGVVESMRRAVEREQGRILRVNGFIFISAPPSVTPFHIDRENNFWLQVKGRKTLHVWDPRDRDVVAGRDVDQFILRGTLDDVRMREGTLERAQTLEVGPGDGVYFPSTSPHATQTETSWVRPGDGVSISIGVVFYTELTRRRAYIHALNSYMRKLRMEPRQPAEPGTDEFRNALKFATGYGVVKVLQRLGRLRTREGF